MGFKNIVTQLKWKHLMRELVKVTRRPLSPVAHALYLFWVDGVVTEETVVARDLPTHT